MHLTLEMLLPLAGILAGTRVAAMLSRRLGLPAVFGELFLGFLIGPAILKWVAPSETMSFLADIGVILLMFLAGLETDLKAVRQVGKASFLSALGGVVLPLLGGYLLGIAFGLSNAKAIFLGAVLTATSVSVSAQTLREMGKLGSRVGATIISSALIDDILGVIIFAAVMSIETGGNMLLTIGRMAIFLPVAWFAGNWLLPRLLKMEKKLGHFEASLGILVGLVLLYAWAAEALGSVATITGAYILGAIVSRHIDLHHPVHNGIASLGYGFFIPIFFVNIGLQARLDGLVEGEERESFDSAGPTQLLSLNAINASIEEVVAERVAEDVEPEHGETDRRRRRARAAAGLGARLGSLPAHLALQVGVGMVSRGEVALVIAGAGLASGLLDSAIFSTLIVVTLITTLITPPLLRLVATPPTLRPIHLPESLSLPIENWRDYTVTVEEQA